MTGSARRHLRGAQSRVYDFRRYDAHASSSRPHACDAPAPPGGRRVPCPPAPVHRGLAAGRSRGGLAGLADRRAGAVGASAGVRARADLARLHSTAPLPLAPGPGHASAHRAGSLAGARLMLWLLNRYSFLITSALVMGLAWLFGARFGGLWPSIAVAGAGLGLALV